MKMDEIACVALYGKVSWDIEDVIKFIAGMESAFSFLHVAATHYGYCETPFQKYGPRIGSVRNVRKKVDSIYANGLRLKTLEFFSLPKTYTFQYSDYIAYFARGVDYLVIAWDPAQCGSPDTRLLLAKMREHISAVWGEYFTIPKGEQPVTHCMEAFSKNPLGSSVPGAKQGDGIQVIRRFTFSTE